MRVRGSTAPAAAATAIATLVLLCAAAPPAFAATAAPAAASAAEAPAAAAQAATSPAGADVAVEELVRQADAAFGREDYAAARRLYAAALEKAPRSLHVLRRLALLRSWDDVDEALPLYRRARELAPDDLDLALEHARALTWNDDLSEAIRLYEELRAAHPDDPRVLLGLGQALAWKGRHAEADAIYRAMEERGIEPIQAHNARALLLAWQGDHPGAIAFYRDVMRADPGNLDARLGIARVHHWQGLDKSAKAQASNILLDHPGNRDARALRDEIATSLRPRAGIDAWRRSDSDSNRVDAVTASYVFQADPQTQIRLAYDTLDAASRCEAATFCNEPGSAPGDLTDAAAQVLSGQLTARIIAPLTFNAGIGIVRQETFGGTTRSLPIGGGYLRWQVGPRFGILGSGGREALLDTAVLIDRGIRVDWGDVRLEYKFHPRWTLAGSGGYGTYSDGNGRRTAAASIAWQVRPAHPRVVGTLEARYREFNDDKDNGYFDPERYDAETLTVAAGDAYRRGRLFWSLEGTYGRQDFTTGPSAGIGAGSDDVVQAVYASAGTKLSERATLEAFYARSDYALQIATGFRSSRAGFVFRLRM